MKLRPAIHFTPKYGWVNDPNGLILYKGRYHIFFQHNPKGLIWDSMHWGHAVSDDLMHWEELPIALYPDEMGDIYSGSCIYDAENISGLGSADNPPLLAFYTSHHSQTQREQQCLAFSSDGITFEKYEGNPIIPGFDHTPARDPHVFANPVRGGFSLCITKEDRIEFYHSTNLLSWEKTGEYFLPEYAFSGMIECPCMTFLDVEGQGIKKAVLMMSMDIAKDAPREFLKFPEGCKPHTRLMQYFVGEFDGDTFSEDKTAESMAEVMSDGLEDSPYLVDYGLDFYAGTVFANCKDTILMAWLGNSEESMSIPTEEEGFRGILSFPRKLSLIQQESGYCLKQSFYAENIETSDGVSYVSDQDGECLIDHCVSERISPDGTKVYTNYRLDTTDY